MAKPACWNDDPECGHEVSCAYQTHYCTYIRVPRLLTLQQPASPDELALITAYQWYELWLKVLLLDLRSALEADPSTYEPVKLLRRGHELFKLFDQHADLAETINVRELGLRRAVRGWGGGQPSEQLAEIVRLAAGVRPMARAASGAMPADAGDAPAETLAAAAREYLARLENFAARFEAFAQATLRPGGAGDPTYAEWLRLPELLSLQEGVKGDWAAKGDLPGAFWKPDQVSADENMFIAVHQCFEVYFKLVLSLVDQALPALQAGRIEQATRLLRRAVLVQRLMVPQIQIPATMLPLDFLRFREQKQERDGKTLLAGLTPASGTESYQFREIEIVCGLRDDVVFQRYLAGSDKLPIRLTTSRQRERLAQPTLPEAFEQAARQRGIDDFRAIFTPAHVHNPHYDLAVLADTLLDFDEFFRFWRLGHVSMVEKMIGSRSGTGFLGPEYLAETAGLKLQEKNRVFEDRQVRPRFFEALWKARGSM